MKKYSYDVGKLEELYGLDKGFLHSDVVIIDNEIQNDISDGWIYANAKICVVGILFKDKIEIFCAEYDDDTKFKDAVKQRLNELKAEKFYAFNKYMEMGNFQGDMNFKIEIHEIKPFNAQGWNKDKFFQTLHENHIIPIFKVFDPFNGNAGLCIDRWGKYLSMNDICYLKEIVLHNINCLLKERVILSNKQYFIDNYSINDKGWLI